MSRRGLVPLAAALALVAAGCGSGKTVSPAPETVEGTLPTTTTSTSTAKGDAAAGKKLFASNGCGGCHTFKPAGASGQVGPDLGKLAADAQKAKHGSVEQYATESIKDPGAYVAPGFSNGMPSFSQLSDQDVANLVAFLTQKS
jgi:mono/diheme cytochrome c family protein